VYHKEWSSITTSGQPGPSQLMSKVPSVEHRSVGEVSEACHDGAYPSRIVGAQCEIIIVGARWKAGCRAYQSWYGRFMIEYESLHNI
jgi:hypothetical protein